MGFNRKFLKKLFKKSVEQIRKEGGEQAFEKWKKEKEEIEKATPTYKVKEVVHDRPIITPIIRTEGELPVKVIEQPISSNNATNQQTMQIRINTKAMKETTNNPKLNQKVIETTQAPIIINFPDISEALSRKKEITDITEKKSAVRGIPLMIHKMPKDKVLKKISNAWEAPNLKDIDVRYPLIEPYAYAVIKWNEEIEALSYTVIEPPLTKKEKEKLETLKGLIIDLLDVNLMDVKNIREVQKYLKQKLNQMIQDYEINLTEVEYNKILYYIYRNFLGLGKIEPLMQDPSIEDISCDGVNIPIFVYHRKYGSLKTNIVFESQDELNKFISKLAQRAGKHISVAEPLLDGALPDGSRLQATYSSGKDIAMRGSTFTIRKFTKDPLTITDFINFGTIPPLIAAYLWLVIEYHNSILISGGTATGKTSTLNALCLFLPPEAKIVSIEDTPELRLPHEHWIAKVARIGYGPEGESGRRKGEVSMFDLLKAALRERPDEIIVGEVRGSEAYVLFQGMATGHAGLATIHAESIEAVINRLTTPPINLSAGLLQHLDVVLIMGFARIKGIDVRRVKEVVEVIGVDEKTNKPITNTLFKWVPAGDYFEFSSDRSYLLNKIIEEKGVPEKSIWEEIERRQAILEWMKKENIRYYKDVGKIVASYYKNPEEVMKKINESK